MRSRLFALLVVASIVGVGCGGQATATPQSTTFATSDAGLQEILARGKLQIGYANQEPYSYVTESGQLKGLDPDIERACQQMLGLPKLEFVEVPFEGLIPGLQSKRFDMVGAMAYRPERAVVAHPAVAAYNFRATLAVKKGNPLNIHSIDDLKRVQGKIGGVLGALEFIQLQQNPDLKDRVVGYQASLDGYKDLEAGRLIGFADGEPLLIVYLQKNPTSSMEIAKPFPPFYDSGAHMYFRPDSNALWALFQDCIKKLKQDGTMVKILQANNYPAENMAPVDAKVSD